MSLLSDLVETSLDPGYAHAHSQGVPPRRSRVLMLVTLLVAGAMLAIAAVTDTRDQPAQARERAALIDQVKGLREENEQLRRQLAEVEGDVEKLQAQALGKDSTPAAELSRQAAQTAAAAVTGPGVVVTVDDSTTLDGADAEVLDQDLRILVNGLWLAGAEAIAINGHRLSARTAIRGAGRAITVDYTSLTRPYVVEAIGNPKALPGRLTANSGGRWWVYLKQNFGMRYDLTTSTSITLQADPGLGVRKARPHP